MRLRRSVVVLLTLLVIAAAIAYVAAPYVRAASLFVRVANIGGRLEALADARAGDVAVQPPHMVPTREGDVAAQFRQALANLKAVVDEAGGAMTDIVKLTIFVADKPAYQANLKPIGAAYREFFGRYYPAMTLVEVKNLLEVDALIEIEGMAVIESRSQSQSRERNRR